MTTLEITGIVLLGVVTLGLVLIAVPKLVFWLLKGPLEARIAADYGTGKVLMQDLKANCFGVESAGVWQARGNGGLVLTAEGLHFFMFLPRKDLRVPLDAVTEVTLTKSHLGKATIYDLLKVRFVAEGKPDSIAWFLTDPAAWLERIEKLKSDRTGNGR